MDMINITNARNDLYNIIKGVGDSHKPLLIKGKDNDVVMVSADDWSAIEETIFLNSVPDLVDKINRAGAEPLSEGTPLEDVEW